jgi:hypothetical protein
MDANPVGSRSGDPIALVQRRDTQQSGCTLVLSEDMSDGQTYGTVTVRNPSAVIRL